jgi:zinc protease
MKPGSLLPIVLMGMMLKPAPAGGAFKLPSPEKIVLANGITVYFLKTADVPIVSFRLRIRGAGTAFEPAVHEGIAGLTAELLLKGNASQNAEAIAEALDFMGAGLNVSAAEEYADIGAESMSEHFPRLMQIMTQCLTAPTFSTEEFEKERAKRIDGIKAVKDNPGTAVPYYFQKAYFGGHPMGRLSSGTEASLQKTAAGDVKAYFREYYLPERAVAAVVGDIQKKTLVRLLDGTLGKWKAGSTKPPSLELPDLPRLQGPKLVLVDKPDATQAYFILGSPGYAEGDRIMPDASVVNTLFGGRFTSWLITELRIKRGLTYGARSSFESWADGGLFQASSYTQNSKIGEMLDITFGLLKKATSAGFEAEEVESARNYIQGRFPPSLETNGSKAAAYVHLAFYKLGFDYNDKYLERVRTATKESVDAAAARLLPRRDYVLVIVGKADDIRPLLTKYGSWTEKKITDPGF